ncbi:hypothetical protein [Streptomyces sp. NPDC050546]|uniref:hypothetical protein n=1 Tax=Streptomyces sp. NPDC050546 TaxID=3365628 RepID=UPI0037AC2D46
MYDAIDNATAYRAELSARVAEPVLSDDPVLQYDLQLPDSWWTDLAEVLEKVSAAGTERVAVRQQYMDRAIPEFLGIPAPTTTCWTTAHGDVHWANLTVPSLRLLGWEGWGQAPAGFDAAMLYAYTLLQPDTAAHVRAAFPILGSTADLAAGVTVCAQLPPDRGPRRQPCPRRPAPHLGRGTALGGRAVQAPLDLTQVDIQQPCPGQQMCAWLAIRCPPVPVVHSSLGSGPVPDTEVRGTPHRRL